MEEERKAGVKWKEDMEISCDAVREGLKEHCPHMPLVLN